MGLESEGKKTRKTPVIASALLRRKSSFCDSLKHHRARFHDSNHPVLTTISSELFVQFKLLESCGILVGLFVWLVGFWTSSSTTRLYRGRATRQTVWQFYVLPATHDTELGDHDFCLSRSHYTDTDPTSRKRAASAGIEPGTSSPGVARSTDWATAPPRFLLD